MSVLVYGLNYRTAPVSLLERLAVPAEQLGKALASLNARPHVAEAVILSTCNRVEVVARVTRYHGGVADVRDFFCEWGAIEPEAFCDRTYEAFEEGAAAHLFAVASGLDSMVLGERQIALQVKQAYAAAEAEDAVGRVLGALFRQALRVAKRTRAETGIAAGASSMVDVGVEAAEGVLGDLQGATVLIVGAGKMGGMAATRLAGRASRLLVANRTAEKADRLADRVGGEVVAPGGLRDALAAADVVVASTGASEPIVDADVVAEAMATRPERPLVLVDLAVPRDIDPACGEIDGVTVLDVDAIRAVADTGRTGAEAVRARAMVIEEARAFTEWTHAVRVEPTVAALRARADAVREAEERRLAKRLASLDPAQRAAVEALTRGIVNTLLHEPSVRLKRAADGPDGDLHAAVLRDLFDLPE